MKKEKQIQIKKKIKSELIKCINDPVYFIKTYCVIQHPIKGRIKFALFPFQEVLLKDFQKHRFNIILKSRQLGISTLSAAYIMWKCLFTDDYSVLLIATKSSVAGAIVRKVRIMYGDLPEWFKSKKLGTFRVENNVMSQAFNNGSRIIAESCTETSGRSGSFAMIIIDEAAFIREKFITDLWSAAFPTLSTGGQAIILSTPNGQGNWFHRMWVDAVAGLNGFFTTILFWTVHPDRDQKWRDEQTLILGDEMAAQECLSGDTIVTIRNKKTKKIKQITLKKLYEKYN
jgi:hypothetical protein